MLSNFVVIDINAVCNNEVIIIDTKSAGKSYNEKPCLQGPEFFRDYASLGGLVNVI